MELLWTLLVLVGVAAAIAGLALARSRRGRRAVAGSAESRPASTPSGVAELRPVGVSEVVARLSVAVDDPDRPSVQRLARDLAERTFATSDRVEQVVVEDRDGHHVVTIPRHEPPLPPAPATPGHVGSEGRPDAPHTRRRTPLTAAPRLSDDASVPGRTLAERLQLPEAVRARVQRPDDAVDVIRAILTAGGHEPHVADGLLHVEDVVVVVVQDAYETAAALGRAFLRFQRSGARSGIVVQVGHVDAAELRRRDALVPQLAYVGPDAIQRMADAVELGLDPLAAARDRDHLRGS